MTTIYLIRHGEAEGNLYRRCHGHYNSSITPNGHHQLAALEQRFLTIPVDAVYASDLRRAVTTAQAVSQPKGLSVITDPNLREIGSGIWEDVPWGQLERTCPESLRRHLTCDPTWQVEGSETFPAVAQRMEVALRAIGQRHPNGSVAVVSHGNAIRAVLARFLGVEMHDLSLVENTSVTTLELEGDSVTVKQMGDASHLPKELSTAAYHARMMAQFPDGKNQLWFRPMDLPREGELYQSCRHDAWLNIHKTEEGYDGDRFLREALAHSAYDSSAVMIAMLGEEMVGLIQMDFEKDREKHIGCIPFCYLTAKFRAKGLGVQLLGQAVSTYRKQGRNRLRLRCSPDNLPAQGFYKKCGFYKVGWADNSNVPLELLDMDI
jgi:probable phosphoglycerate mutase